MSDLQQTMSLLVSRLVHDFKNPLAVVLSNLRYLQAVVDGGEEQEALRESVVSADRLDGMLDDMVTIAHLKAGKDRGESPESVPLTDLGTDVSDKLELLIGNRELEIQLPPVTLTTERGLLFRAVINIVEHALRHTPSRGKVVFDGEVDDDGLLLRVFDGGAPFDPAEQPSFLAEDLPVNMGPPARHRSDQGLRLFFAGLAMRTLGATTEVRVREDGPEGTVFAMRFPKELVS